jgi:hypothetical protein
MLHIFVQFSHVNISTMEAKAECILGKEINLK